MRAKIMLSTSKFVLAARGLLLWSVFATGSVAVAQWSGIQAAAPPLRSAEEVIVRSPYIVQRERPTRSPAPYNFDNPELISVSRHVSYADLNLFSPTGIAVLERRIRDTAKDVCEELERRYARTQLYVHANMDCVRKAVDDATKAMQRVTAVASR